MNEINVEDAVIKSVRMYNDDYELFKLLAKENGITNFDQLIPDEFKNTFSGKHGKHAAIPLI